MQSLVRLFVVVAFLFILPPVFAQVIKGRVFDAETGESLKDVVLVYGDKSARSEPDGSFVLEIKASESVVSVSRIGYLTTSFVVTPDTQKLELGILKKYEELPDVVIASVGTDANDILASAQKHIPENYIEPTENLKYVCTASIYRDEEKMLEGSIPVYWTSNGRPDFILYDIRKRKEDTFSLAVNRVTADAISDYAVFYNLAGNAFALSGFLVPKNQKYFRAFISAFEEDNKSYYDIVFLARKAEKIKVGLALKVLGFTKFSPKQAVSLEHFQVCKDDFAVVKYESISIGENDQQHEQFEHIKDRNDLARWLSTASFYYRATLTFKQRQDGKYLLDRWYVYDNLLNFAYKGRSFPRGAWEYSFSYESGIAEMPSSIDFNIVSELKSAYSIAQ